MNENDRKSSKRQAFINFYLAEKEFFLPDDLRSALDFIYKLIKEKHMDKALAIDIVNKWNIKHKDMDYGKMFLWKKYNARMAYIKNATDKYYEWCIEMRKKSAGIIPTCACGCGKAVKKGNKFVHGHNINMRSKEEKEKYTKIMLDKRPGKKSKKVVHVNFSKST